VAGNPTASGEETGFEIRFVPGGVEHELTIHVDIDGVVRPVLTTKVAVVEDPDSIRQWLSQDGHEPLLTVERGLSIDQVLECLQPLCDPRVLRVRYDPLASPEEPAHHR